MTTPVFLNIEANPNPQEKDALQAYSSKAQKIVKEYGGVPVATYDVQHSLDGEAGPAVFAVLSFPDKESISDLFADPNYQAIVPLRERGFSHIRYFVTIERC